MSHKTNLPGDTPTYGTTVISVDPNELINFALNRITVNVV